MYSVMSNGCQPSTLKKNPDTVVFFYLRERERETHTHTHTHTLNQY